MRMHVCMHVCMHACVHVLSTRTYIHMYTHTQLDRFACLSAWLPIYPCMAGAEIQTAIREGMLDQ